MAAEKHEEGAAEPVKQKEKKGGSKKLLIIILAAVLVLGGAGGFAAYKLFFSKAKAGEAEHKKEAQKSVLVALDPFVVNLTDQGRYLKVTMQLEIMDAAQQAMFQEKMPNIRDTVITLLSSKSAESVAGPEGKLQLKDELILRVNQAVGKDVLKNLYFTDFVMQ
ncbi:MAG: flagellar basal body protein FliL [Nitrospirales bacterium]|nr:flagellar basal body protein FliL [Nitrospirales bacterium]